MLRNRFERIEPGILTWRELDLVTGGGGDDGPDPPTGFGPLPGADGGDEGPDPPTGP